MADIDGAPNRRVPFRIRSIQSLFTRPTQLRGWVKHTRAPRRHRIWKVTLVDTLFNLLDSLNVGALGRDELVEFALLTGSQGDIDVLHDQAALLLDTWGSSLVSRFSTNRISMLCFRQIVSRTHLALSKAELRRAIRFARAMEPLCPMTLHERSLWRSFKHAQIFREAQHWKQRIVWNRYDHAFLPFPTRSSAASQSGY